MSIISGLAASVQQAAVSTAASTTHSGLDWGCKICSKLGVPMYSLALIACSGGAAPVQLKGEELKNQPKHNMTALLALKLLVVRLLDPTVATRPLGHIIVGHNTLGDAGRLGGIRWPAQRRVLASNTMQAFIDRT